MYIGLFRHSSVSLPLYLSIITSTILSAPSIWFSTDWNFDLAVTGKATHKKRTTSPYCQRILDASEFFVIRVERSLSLMEKRILTRVSWKSLDFCGVRILSKFMTASVEITVSILITPNPTYKFIVECKACMDPVSECQPFDLISKGLLYHGLVMSILNILID